MSERDAAKSEVDDTHAAEAVEGEKSESDADTDAAEAEEVSEAPESRNERSDEDEPVVAVVPEPTEEEKLRAQLEKNQARLRTVSKAYTDLQGEMASFRERTEHLGKMKAERASFDAVAAFFDPVQNLTRSLEAGSEDLTSLRQGVEMVVHQFSEAMRKLGLEPVAGVGAPFDPNMHEALAVTPVTDEAQDGKVLIVHQGGYAVNGKVLQAAQAVIAKYQAPPTEEN